MKKWIIAAVAYTAIGLLWVFSMSYSKRIPDAVSPRVQTKIIVAAADDFLKYQLF